MHIGTPKTATSSIQYFLKNEFLHNDDFCYLDTLTPEINSHKWILGVFNKPPNIIINTIFSLIESSPQKNIVISEEDLVYFDSSILFKLFSSYNTKVIVYFRSPFLMESSALTYESQSSVFSFRNQSNVFQIIARDDSWLPRSFYTFSYFFKNWYDKLPKDIFELVDFDKCLSSSDPVSKFCELIGYKFSNNSNFKHVNQTFSFQALYCYIEIFRQSNNQLLVPDLASSLSALDRSHIFDSVQGTYFSKDYIFHEDPNRMALFHKVGDLLSSHDFFDIGKRLIMSKDVITSAFMHSFYNTYSDEIKSFF